ncbi:hypothetical protein R3P38DRAFT_2778577 [Favolaschia claudopus]|uniref:Uncharacterized protein n=1 Tax=Favolaschia claudopus TaxID=2862362 RepID=A0AAW0BHQ5_9AGAR
MTGINTAKQRVLEGRDLGRRFWRRGHIGRRSATEGGGKAGRSKPPLGATFRVPPKSVASQEHKTPELSSEIEAAADRHPLSVYKIFPPPSPRRCTKSPWLKHERHAPFSGSTYSTHALETERLRAWAQNVVAYLELMIFQPPSVARDESDISLCGPPEHRRKLEDHRYRRANLRELHIHQGACELYKNQQALQDERAAGLEDPLARRKAKRRRLREGTEAQNPTVQPAMS